MWVTATVEETNRQLAETIMRHAAGAWSGRRATAIPGFMLARWEAAEELQEFYTPFIGYTVQGGKHTLVGADEFRYGSGHCFVAGVDMPSKSTIVTASPDEPFLALALELDRELVMRLSAGMVAARGVPRGVAVMPAEARVAHAFLRLMALLDEPAEIAVMAPLLVREIHHRLLLGPQGGWLRAICTGGSAGNRVAKAVSWIRGNFKNPLSVPELAKNAGMSESSFFRVFREVTSLSPLQFQKTLRLYEAQRLLVSGAANVENTAYAVGYESASQFVREYKRMFGEPPKRDTARRRGVAVE
ncbi:MAG: AraC family transcriptional regulator [Ottowia sp.]|nr:AraC family transcriptional regulator [Ottowia sp.]